MNASRAIVTRAFAETDELLANPGMGWQTFHRFADQDRALQGLPSSSAYFRLYWSEIEPEEGRIDLGKLDGLLAGAEGAGQQLAFRLMCVGTNREYLHVPQWLRDGGCPGWEFAYDDVKHWCPDMDSGLFQEAHFRTIRALGERYDGDLRLGLLDIGTVGLWGEWHMSGTSVELPTEATRIGIIDTWRAAFPQTPKVMLIGDEPGTRYCVQRGIGWRADCLGDMGGFSPTWNHMDDCYLQQIELAAAQDAWQTAPVAFESCWTMRKWVQEGWDVRYIFDYALGLHASYLNNKSASIPEGFRPEVERLLRRLGYRLVLREVAHAQTVKRGDDLEVKQLWENVGVAPPYGDYRVALAAYGPRTVYGGLGDSVQGWLPGRHEVRAVLSTRELEPGAYRLGVGVRRWVDADAHPDAEPLGRGTEASAGPALRLAIDAQQTDAYYLVSEFEVTA